MNALTKESAKARSGPKSAPASREVGELHVLDHRTELEQLQDQLMLAVQDVGSIYRRERQQAHKLDALMKELRDTYLRMVQTLAFVVEAKDEYTRYHLERCKEYATALAEEIDPSLATTEVQYGFLLHDVGKIGVPESILSKPSPLSEEEWRLMRTHPVHGVSIVQAMRFLDERAIAVIRHHHERFDGNGYPDGLSGEDIPLAARLFSVVDAFDAMTTDRPYRRALPSDVALARIAKAAGTQFDPHVVGVFLDLVKRRRESTS
jgi:HD-GYP domain-containing protein (c-di-GMP phosphodiesterase class II)